VVDKVSESEVVVRNSALKWTMAWLFFLVVLCVPAIFCLVQAQKTTSKGGEVVPVRLRGPAQRRVRAHLRAYIHTYIYTYIHAYAPPPCCSPTPCRPGSPHLTLQPSASWGEPHHRDILQGRGRFEDSWQRWAGAAQRTPCAPVHRA